ncbi:MAG: hypothetical protein HOV80_11035 [Polyangiaceae bacterium]|nr:hypothetical protein [Polyangiaceae bacterium]
MDAEREAEQELEPEEYLAAVKTKGRRRLRRILGILGVFLFANIVAFGAPWMIRNAEESDKDCSNRDYQVAPGESDGCGWRARAWIQLPKLVPWTRKRALDREGDLLRDQAERALRNAAEVTPNTRARDEAAARFVEASKGGPWILERSSDRETVTIDPRDGLIAILTSDGAYAAAARAHVAVADPQSLGWAFDAAIAMGDVETAAQIARRDTSADYQTDLKAGALLCLLGDDANGSRRLARAEADYSARVGPDYKYADAQLARVLCGDPGVTTAGSVGRTAVHAAKLYSEKYRGSLPLDMLPDVDRVSFFADERLDIDEARSPFVAAWLVSREHPIEQVVDVIGPLSFQLGGAVSPYTIGGAESRAFLSSYPVVVEPATHEKAAALLEALAAGLAAKPVAPVGKTAPPKVRPIEEYSRAAQAIANARKQPERALRSAAWMLWIEAASQHAALRKFDAANAAMAHALSLDGSADTRIFAASLAYAMDDLAGAKTHLAELDKGSPDVTVAALAGILDVFIAMREGRWEDAHARAKRTHEAAKDPVRDSTAWLLAATAIRVGRPDEGPGITTPEGYEQPATTWEKVAAMTEAERKVFRLRLFGVDPPRGGPLVMPAVYYVVGQAAEGTDPEAWLDAAIPLAYSHYHSSTGHRARAEAARWRGDEAAAKELEERARKIDALTDDPAKLVFAKLARLR